jgi:GntR family transcriptional regulator
MEFYIEKNSSTPVIKQIEEQIKWAVMMGIFRNGDTLPSIRDIEKQTGVHHSQIHKAYLALRRSGLVVLTRGKGSVISTASESPRLINENCYELSRKMVDKARQLGLSPTAFARYFSRYSQESERKEPFISYVDDNEEIATQTADEISQLWQVPVKGLSYKELKIAISKGTATQKIMVNHVMSDLVSSLLPRKKSAVISIEVRISEQTIKLLAEIKSGASILLLHMPQPSHRLHYMIEQLRKLVKAPDVKISSRSVREVPDLSELLNSAQYDRYLIGPGARGEVPQEMRKNPRVVQIVPQLDPASLEIARIRAGVVI